MKPIAICLCVLGAASFLHASSRTWHEYSFNDGYGTVAMSRNDTWPVVATMNNIYFSNPTGFTKSTSGGTYLISGPNNQLAARSASSNQTIKLFKNNSWNTIAAPSLFYDVAFDREGNLHAAFSYGAGTGMRYGVFNGVSWIRRETSITASVVFDIEIDSYETPVIAADNKIISPSLPGGYWDITVPGGTALIKDMALTTSGIPGVLLMSSDLSALYYASYNPQQQSWNSELIASNVYGYSMLQFDHWDHPAAVFADNNGKLFFTTNDGTGSGWELCQVGTLSGASISSLAFDYANNPVVCFSSSSETIVKYDPLVPEPASIMIGLPALALLLKKRVRFIS